MIIWEVLKKFFSIGDAVGASVAVITDTAQNGYTWLVNSWQRYQRTVTIRRGEDKDGQAVFYFTGIVLPKRITKEEAQQALEQQIAAIERSENDVPWNTTMEPERYQVKITVPYGTSIAEIDFGNLEKFFPEVTDESNTQNILGDNDARRKQVLEVLRLHAKFIGQDSKPQEKVNQRFAQAWMSDVKHDSSILRTVTSWGSSVANTIANLFSQQTYQTNFTINDDRQHESCTDAWMSALLSEAACPGKEKLVENFFATQQHSLAVLAERNQQILTATRELLAEQKRQRRRLIITLATIVSVLAVGFILTAVFAPSAAIVVTTLTAINAILPKITSLSGLSYTALVAWLALRVAPGYRAKKLALLEANCQVGEQLAKDYRRKLAISISLDQMYRNLLLSLQQGELLFAKVIDSKQQHIVLDFLNNYLTTPHCHLRTLDLTGVKLSEEEVQKLIASLKSNLTLAFTLTQLKIDNLTMEQQEEVNQIIALNKSLQDDHYSKELARELILRVRPDLNVIPDLPVEDFTTYEALQIALQNFSIKQQLFEQLITQQLAEDKFIYILQQLQQGDSGTKLFQRYLTNSNKHNRYFKYVGSQRINEEMLQFMEKFFGVFSYFTEEQKEQFIAWFRHDQQATTQNLQKLFYTVQNEDRCREILNNILSSTVTGEELEARINLLIQWFRLDRAACDSLFSDAQFMHIMQQLITCQAPGWLWQVHENKIGDIYKLLKEYRRQCFAQRNTDTATLLDKMLHAKDPNIYRIRHILSESTSPERFTAFVCAIKKQDDDTIKNICHANHAENIEPRGGRFIKKLSEVLRSLSAKELLAELKPLMTEKNSDKLIYVLQAGFRDKTYYTQSHDDIPAKARLVASLLTEMASQGEKSSFLAGDVLACFSSPSLVTSYYTYDQLLTCLQQHLKEEYIKGNWERVNLLEKIIWNGCIHKEQQSFAQYQLKQFFTGPWQKIASKELVLHLSAVCENIPKDELKNELKQYPVALLVEKLMGDVEWQKIPDEVLFVAVQEIHGGKDVDGYYKIIKKLAKSANAEAKKTIIQQVFGSRGIFGFGKKEPLSLQEFNKIHDYPLRKPTEQQAQPRQSNSCC